MERVCRVVVCALLLGMLSAGNGLADTKDEIVGPPRPGPLERIEKEEDGLFRAFGWGLHFAAASDVASTEWALAQPGFYEQNPLMSHRGVRVAAHVAVPAAVWWASRKVREKGHPRAALLMRIGLTAVYGYAALHNLRTVHAR